MNELIQAALDVRQKAYAPYSDFLVGAALLTFDDQIFVGCNVENASYGLAICAERHAIGAAVAAGHQRFKAIAVTASPLASPCGACRQYIFEFGDNIEIIGVDANDPSIVKNWISGDLLPDGFHL